MSRQDKATTEKFTRTLRELVKLPENKVCADCKRNDPRWASWNLGLFLCIRCSGIHRGMGTHISKVKSVDLDVWTPEQMESIQKWGNRLANLYWEAHLKPGHIPPEHKMESFIRSKYESRRWALEGPLPTDPSILDNGSSKTEAAPPPPPSQEASPSPSTTRVAHNSNDGASSRQPSTTATRQSQSRQLLSAGYTNQQPSASRNPNSAVATPIPTATPAPQPKEPENDLFSLDFHAPAVSSPSNNPAQQQQPKKDVKQDILSLFSTPAAPPGPPAPPFGQFGAAPAGQTSPWGTIPAQQQVPTSMIGTSGPGAWGVSSGWNGGLAAAAPPMQGNIWGNPTLPQPQANLFASGPDVWGNTPPPQTSSQMDPFGSSATPAPKKDDVFGDIWGGFK